MCRVIFESVDYEILSAEATSMSLHSSSIYIISGHPSIKKPSFCLIAWRSTKRCDDLLETATDAVDFIAVFSSALGFQAITKRAIY